MKDDAISRQAVLKLLYSLPPEETMTKAMLIQSVKQMAAAQPAGPDNLVNDCISRQAAIDALGKEGLITAMVIVDRLPSAQPEIVRCKDCKHNRLPTSANASCEIFYGMTYRDGFCHMAERRTNEPTSER